MRSDSIPRITEIRAIPIFERHAGAKASTATNEYTLVEVKTDAGLTGTNVKLHLPAHVRTAFTTYQAGK